MTAPGSTTADSKMSSMSAGLRGLPGATTARALTVIETALAVIAA